MTISNASITSNHASGASGVNGAAGGIGLAGAAGTSGGNARGGGIYLAAGQLNVIDSAIGSNNAHGGHGGNGGAGGNGRTAQRVEMEAPRAPVARRAQVGQVLAAGFTWQAARCDWSSQVLVETSLQVLREATAAMEVAAAMAGTAPLGTVPRPEGQAGVRAATGCRCERGQWQASAVRRDPAAMAAPAKAAAFTLQRARCR